MTRAGRPAGSLRSWLATAPKGGITVHIFRFEQGRIAEHWDARRPVTAPNAAGHTELDDGTTVKDLARTRRDKAQVATGMQKVFVRRGTSKFGEPVRSSKHYVQHHHGDVRNGIAGAKPVLDAITRGDFTYTKIDEVLGEGTFALTVSEGTAAGAPKTML